ncbi:hypothetical protein FOMPIDRAFT_82641 [Fomitopsis schrenkii]|uniref:Hydrophobin n=1 Tax=Fomitopsis schrenkii TaxID=2126942 RepID=S8FD32_FOMSC|nr:hypothetical protein FOMPIDRAFT_82641 [Fomitopsis schrenkii]
MRFFGKITAAVAFALAMASAPRTVAQTTCGALCTAGVADSCPLDLVCTPITVPVGIVPGCSGDISIDVCL